MPRSRVGASVIAAALALACVPATPAPATGDTGAAPATTARSTARSTAAATRLVPLGNGLVIDVPRSWTIGPTGIVNRATMRYAFAANVDPTSLPTLAGNGSVDPGALPSGTTTLWIETFGRLQLAGPPDETALPLDWSAATPTPGVAVGRHQLRLGFRWFDLPMFLVGAWSDDAPAADVAAIERAARSLRPDPAPPPAGLFGSWLGLGPLAGIPVGAVRPQPIPAAGGAPARSSWLVRGRQHLFAFVTRPLVDERCQIDYDAAADRFVCDVDGRRYEWTRFGRYLGPEPASDLPQHRVIVREGSAWLRHDATSRSIPSVPDEAAER